ncbi:AAA family ATPase, partial [Streptomyces caeruleatus]
AIAIMDGLHLRPRPGDEVADALEAFVHDGGYSFVVLDSLRRLAGNARENESDEMAPIVARLGELARRLHVGVLVLHHASRAG